MYHGFSSLLRFGWFSFQVFLGSLFNWKEFTFELLSVHFSTLADNQKIAYVNDK